jgi:hypothetical protein
MKPNSLPLTVGDSDVEALLNERADLLARLKQIDATIRVGRQAETALRVNINGTGQETLNLPASFLNLGFLP